MHNNPAVQIEQATVLLTVDQIVEAVRQLSTDDLGQLDTMLKRALGLA